MILETNCSPTQGRHRWICFFWSLLDSPRVATHHLGRGTEFHTEDFSTMPRKRFISVSLLATLATPLVQLEQCPLTKNCSCCLRSVWSLCQTFWIWVIFEHPKSTWMVWYHLIPRITSFVGPLVPRSLLIPVCGACVQLRLWTWLGFFLLRFLVVIQEHFAVPRET